MKAILAMLVIVAAGLFLSNRASFSEERVAVFLSHLEDDISQGNTDEACDKLSDSVVFTINDTTTSPEILLEGGKKELCEHFKEIALVYKTAPIADRHYKANLQVKQSLTKWNTATVSYEEHHEIEFFPERNKVKTRSDETMAITTNGDGFLISNWTMDAMSE